MNRYRTTSNSARGQTIIETACALIFVVPFLLFMLDIAFLWFAGEANKQACRDAARAAASVVPNLIGAAPGSNPGPKEVSPPDPTYVRAQAAIERVRERASGDWIKGIQLKKVIVDIGSMPTGSAAIQTFGGTIPGTVTVATELSGRPPVPFPGMSQFTLSNSATFDITAVVQTQVIP